MSDSTAVLKRKIRSAGDLGSVVRAMKAMAASSIGQYEKSVRATKDYTRGVELGLGLLLRQQGRGRKFPAWKPRKTGAPVRAIVFGSDQGLVGSFNERVSRFAAGTLAALKGPPELWAIGERVHARLTDEGLRPVGLHHVPNSVGTIAPLVGRILVEQGTGSDRVPAPELHLFYNRPSTGAVYEPVHQRLLPLDETWRRDLEGLPWPTKSPPDVVGDVSGALRAFLREYLFVSLFRACAESLASENASRLAAMQRAEKNIGDLLVDLNGKFRRQRQMTIDEELFDVISGFEAVKA